MDRTNRDMMELALKIGSLVVVDGKLAGPLAGRTDVLGMVVIVIGADDTIGWASTVDLPAVPGIVRNVADQAERQARAEAADADPVVH